MMHWPALWIGFEPTDMSRLAIVAALEREVRPLTKHWQIRKREHAGRQFRFYETGKVVLVCGGIGPEAARRAAEAVIVLYSPDLLYSVGYAGALDPTLKVADVLTPAHVINGSDGSRVDVSKGEGTLLSLNAVASVAQKYRLRESYGAQAIDMEASAVARAAEARGVGFRAIKVISDEFNFELPADGRFVDAEGHFREARFALHALVRPRLWLPLVQLAKNSARASRSLCAELGAILAEQIPANSSPQIADPR
jgi:adenosylhomocysteine nucleosidase